MTRNSWNLFDLGATGLPLIGNRLTSGELRQSENGQVGLLRLDILGQLQCCEHAAASNLNPRRPTMSMTHEKDLLKSEKLEQQFQEMQAFVRRAAEDGQAIHEVERGLWRRVREMGHELLGQFLRLQGDGDLGETVTLPTGEEVHRLEGRHERRYVSIFGKFGLQRVVYGSREKQHIDFVPLDNRLQLPESVFSYVLQDWDQSLCVEEAFRQASATMWRMLELKQSVDSLEHMNQEMAQGATTFLLNRPQPEKEGELVVASADQKGIVLRRQPDDPPPKAHRTKGEKASQKRMATVATVYTVERYRRTPEEVVSALFRDASEPTRDRPQPQHKEVWASLPQEDQPGSGTAAAFAWLIGELHLRGRAKDKPLLFLSDGQESLWEARRDWLPERAVDILDLLHVTPRLWKAAHVFHPEGSQEAEDFVRERVLRVLQGKAAGVVRGLREMATKHGLVGGKKKTLTTVCAYLEANVERMRYDDYLKAGYPIASGAVEGACRHLVKDRMERAGMHWTLPGAQAMLDVRSIYVSGLWDEYQNYRIESETERLYPHRKLVCEHGVYDIAA